MKLLIASLFILSSPLVFAGAIVNEKTSDTISANCVSLNSSNNCTKYEILLNDDRDSTKHIADLTIRELTDPKDQFLLRENIKKFKYMPVSKFMFGGDVPAYTGGVVGAGLPIMIIGRLMEVTGVVAGTTILGVGAAMTWGGIGVFFLSPVAIDVATMPVRALIKGIRIRNADKDEMIAAEMLTVLLDEQQQNHELSNIKFKRVLKTLKTIKN